jgi:hypothetical protein
MAVAHYTYLVLKMPSPAGVLSLQGDLKISHDCDTEAVEIASTNQVPNAMMEVYAASKKLATSELDILEKSDNANKPQPPEEVLSRRSTSEQATPARPPPSGPASTPNRKTRSSTSSGLTATSSRGSQQTCQECPGS